MQLRLFPLLVYLVLVVGSILVAGCTAPAAQAPAIAPAPATPVTTTAPPVTVVPTSTINSFTSAVTLNVLSVRKNWDADAENDGIAVYPALVNGNNVMIHWQGEPLPVDIEIYTTRFDEKQGYKEVKDHVVYTGQDYLTRWEDAQMLYGVGKGIRVPFEAMDVPPGKSYGNTLATIHLPDGRTFAGIDLATALTP